ncbi:MAG: type II toxin-antitoxin system PemK/MazF family toxin [Deltaproteobacteria bacterium]|nr:type II toxin-antitoxin system PemK/MazF family toxin [Deltaproteobacteria bacterium]
MKTGEIFWVNLDPTLGDEIKKRRPVVVLNPGHSKNLKLAIVVPITGWNILWDNNPFFAVLEPTPVNGLQKRSAIDCFQIRAISHNRFSDKIGEISVDDIGRIKKAVALILDIDPENCI